ncbi:CDP-glucose 4,6-dehydratase [Bdellovibrio sp. HCB-162]|uniref:CDP-glucose 4,6-dehydratase n=1 Tax=Bdellovibrio sp. HCB-162 TaxID=3394234 RepID=UPI0039BC2930
MNGKTASSFWQGKRVFITYPTSFLGAWTALALEHLGAQVFGFSETAGKTPNLFDLTNLAQRISMTYGDLRDEDAFRQVLQFAQADIVLHLGETGLLTEAEKKPLEIFSKSVLGTATLMELLRETASVRSVVVVSSDKVYSRATDNKALSESDKVAAQDILPTAKLCSEFVALSYRNTFFSPEKYNKHKVAVATARIGSAIGGGDFSESSLIPQAVQSFLNKKSFEIRNPQSVRPWIHVLDQVDGILRLAEALYVKGPKLAETYNLGAAEFESIGEVMKEFAQVMGIQSASVSANTNKLSLSLHGQMNSDLAKQHFDWEPRWNLSRALEKTAQWYQTYYKEDSSEHLSENVVEYFS